MQEEVLKVLEKSSKDKPMSRGQIALELNVSPILVSKAINKLLKYSEVKAIDIDRHKAKELYGTYHKMKVYYI